MEDILGDEQPAGTEELRSIVARAGRRRGRLVAASAAVALCAGGGIGYAVSNHSSPAQTVVAGTGSNGEVSNSPASSGATGASGSSGAAVVPEPALYANGAKLTHLFTRTAGDITIRAFLATLPTYAPLNGAATCGLPMLEPRLQVEVSTPNMVGTSYGYSSASTSAFKSSQTVTLGVAEGDPVTVVVVSTSASVANVRFVGTSGQSDQMDPIQGWAVLAVPVRTAPKGAAGSIFARSSTGASLEHTTVNEGVTSLPASPGVLPGCYCHPVLPATGGTGIYNGGVASSGGASGSAGASSSGGASSGSASSGSVSSGSGSSGGASSGSVSSGGVSGSGTATRAPTVACPMIPAGGASQGATSNSK